MAKKDRLRDRKLNDRRKRIRENRAHPIDSVPHLYEASFGVVVSHQDPEAMYLHSIGGVKIHRPGVTAQLKVRKQAEHELRSKHKAGVYTDPKVINQILQERFHFFDTELRNIIPLLGSRHFVEFVLFQYDQSCEVDRRFKGGSLSAKDAEYWRNSGPRWRRALKYLAECACLLGPSEAPTAPEEDILGLTDLAIMYAEELVQMSMLSDQTFMLFPDSTTLTISEPGELDYLELRVRPEVGADFQERVRRDLKTRAKYIALDYPLFDAEFRGAELNAGFAEVFGLTFDQCFSAISTIVDNVVTPSGGFPIAFVKRDQIVTELAKMTGRSGQTIDRLFNGVTVSRANMLAEGRKVWKPKQEHRAYRRAFFDFPHPSGVHLTWSDGMAKECLIIMLRDLAFQHVPPEWEHPSIRAGLASLSNRCGKAFEEVCINHAKIRGCLMAGSYKNGIGVGANRLSIPDLVGELDCLAFEPTSHLLVLLECKLVQSGMEAARLRDDIHQFTNPKNGYFLKFRRKLDWVRANVPGISRALTSLPGAPAQIIPTHVAGAVVTLYPSFATYLNPPAPCVSIGELFSNWDKHHSWPYPSGRFAV